MVKKRTGLLDIAKRVGISKATVSRYLNTPELVSPSLQKRISLVIETLGYLPNKAPNMLSTSKSNAIGVILPSFTSSFFSEILHGIESVADKFDYQIMIAHSGDCADKEERRLRSLLSYNVDGLILSTTLHNAESLKMIKLSGVPVVEIADTSIPYVDMTVGYDNYQISKNVVNQMISSGRKNIIYFNFCADKDCLLRLKGYSDAMEQHGLDTYSISIKEKSSYELGSKLLNEALKNNIQIDVIFCSNDILAAGLFFECQRRKITVPDDILIVVFNGNDIEKFTNMKLLSISIPQFEIGKAATTMLIERINGNEMISKRIVLPINYSGPFYS